MASRAGVDRDRDVDLTEVSGLDAASRPDWYIPPALLPAAEPPRVRGIRVCDRRRQPLAVIRGR